MYNRSMNLCECGCGKPTTIASKNNRKNGYVKGQPMKFLKGHFAKTGKQRGKKNPNYSHGKCHSRVYINWRQMIARCENTRNIAFKNYGGRGIFVCERWHNFSNFFSDMGDAPKEKYLERINNDGPYSPENCKWATMKEQGNNTRRNRWITFNGQRKTLSQWATVLEVHISTLHSRLKQRSIKDAFTLPLKSRPWR